MRKFKFLKLVLVVLFAMYMISYTSGSVYAAQSRRSLDQKLTQTNNKRFYFQKKRQQADLKLKKERNKLSNNQQKLENTKVKLEDTTKQYNDLSTNLTIMEAKLNRSIAQFKDIDLQMKSRIRQVYKHQRTGMFELILSANDINSLMDIFYFEKIIIHDDYRRLQLVKARANEIAILKMQVETQKRLVASSLRDIQNQKATLQGSIAENKNMIARLQKDKQYYLRSERELERQSASIQYMIANLTKHNAKSGTTKVVASGSFIYPISGPITSPFGWRVHPIFKSRIFHSGIDIGGKYGAPIVASNSGKVIYSGWYGGYGKVVILDHGIVNGKPITTLYGHMSSIAVSNGQMVNRGQMVGREGSTGYSTGPHCHFEVRVNGKPTNPLNYI